MFEVWYEENEVWKKNKSTYKSLSSAKKNKYITDDSVNAKVLDVNKGDYVFDSPIVLPKNDEILEKIEEVIEKVDKVIEEKTEKKVKNNKKYKLFDIISVEVERKEKTSVKIRNVKMIDDVEMYDIKMYTDTAVLKTDLVNAKELTSLIESLKK